MSRQTKCLDKQSVEHVSEVGILILNNGLIKWGVQDVSGCPRSVDVRHVLYTDMWAQSVSVLYGSTATSITRGKDEEAKPLFDFAFHWLMGRKLHLLHVFKDFDAYLGSFQYFLPCLLHIPILLNHHVNIGYRE